MAQAGTVNQLQENYARFELFCPSCNSYMLSAVAEYCPKCGNYARRVHTYSKDEAAKLKQ
jgi:hypothetical protein